MADLRIWANGRWVEAQGETDGTVHVTSPIFTTGVIRIPGIVPAAAYVAADAFGTGFSFPVPRFGTISNVIFLDHDDEGLAKDLVLFSAPFTATADNAAFTVSDEDMRYCIGVVSIDRFYNFAVNQIGVATPALSYNLSEGRIYCQVVTQGADNIAAAAMPEIILVVV